MGRGLSWVVKIKRVRIKVLCRTEIRERGTGESSGVRSLEVGPR